MDVAAAAGGAEDEEIETAVATTTPVDGLSLELPPSIHLKDCLKDDPLPFTNFVCGFQATLDHIFASKDFHVRLPTRFPVYFYSLYVFL